MRTSDNFHADHPAEPGPRPRTAARDAMRVVVVEEQNLFGEALSMVLERAGYAAFLVPVSGEHSEHALVRAIDRLDPGVVLLDLDPGARRDCSTLVSALSVAGMSVVVMVDSTDRARWGQCIALGARRVVHKSAPLTEILATIRRLENGLPVLSRDDRDQLLALWQREVESAAEIRRRLEGLTRREGEVLGMLMDGKQVGDIARERFVAESTVRTQVKAILAKLQVNSQITAVGLAHKAGWTPAVEAGLPLARTAERPARRSDHVVPVRSRAHARLIPQR
ncbi:MAG TPA: response regulator transcription factor [Marmoricola sp.]